MGQERLAGDFPGDIRCGCECGRGEGERAEDVVLRRVECVEISRDGDEVGEHVSVLTLFLFSFLSFSLGDLGFEREGERKWRGKMNGPGTKALGNECITSFSLTNKHLQLAPLPRTHGKPQKATRPQHNLLIKSTQLDDALPLSDDLRNTTLILYRPRSRNPCPNRKRRGATALEKVLGGFHPADRAGHRIHHEYHAV